VSIWHTYPRGFRCQAPKPNSTGRLALRPRRDSISNSHMACITVGATTRLSLQWTRTSSCKGCHSSLCMDEPSSDKSYSQNIRSQRLLCCFNADMSSSGCSWPFLSEASSQSRSERCSELPIGGLQELARVQIFSSSKSSCLVKFIVTES
jgi:hypothetical protein